MRPTGRMHIGHYHGALKNWLRLQEEYECLYFAADWHALTTHYETPERSPTASGRCSSTGSRPASTRPRSTIFIQSRVPEHAELTLLLGMIAPVGWLERVPTYKDQQQKLADRDLSNFGFLGYPVMQGGGHPDLPGEHGACRRGPGVAHRAGARARAPLQPHLRRASRVRGEGEGGDQEARLRSRRSAMPSCAPRSRSRATRPRSKPRARC